MAHHHRYDCGCTIRYRAAVHPHFPAAAAVTLCAAHRYLAAASEDVVEVAEAVTRIKEAEKAAPMLTGQRGR